MSGRSDQLRGLADCDSRAGAPLGKAMRGAAAYIEELEAQRDALLGAVRPFAKMANEPQRISAVFGRAQYMTINVLGDDLRKAAEALSLYESKPGRER
jgi:hypothetical protein